MTRDAMLGQVLARRDPWDIIIIGGGATGAGVAVDAVSRGYSVLLLERHDFGKGTSSRSTKLVHGGIRYLAQGNISLVHEALRERDLLRANAPHLVQAMPFVVPSYSWWAGPFYGVGLLVYELLAGQRSFGRTRWLSRAIALKYVQTLNPQDLRGGILYHDGQFDDARLLINLLQTAVERGACVLNYAPVVQFIHDTSGAIHGVVARDEESTAEFRAAARMVVNATGVFCDQVRKTANPFAPALVVLSQGIHLVFGRQFLPGDAAVVVPQTPDGRVMFAIPWHGHTLIGTTDVAVPEAAVEPRPTEQEIDFVLETAGRYLTQKPTRADVLSAFAGIRPLVRTGAATNTAALSRDHTIHIDGPGLLTITGGKWTTYRNMAEDSVNRAAVLAGLPARRCTTHRLRIHGYHTHATRFGPLAVYGSDAPAIQQLGHNDPTLTERLHPALPYTAAEVVWAARTEMARTVEDVLARRLRALFLNAQAAVEMAPRVAKLLAGELGRDTRWQAAQVAAFTELARGYRLV